MQLQPLKLPCVARGGLCPQRKQYPRAHLLHPRHRRRRCGGGISRHSRTYGHAREHVNGTCHRWFFESHLSTKAARLFPFYSPGWPPLSPQLIFTYIRFSPRRCLSRTSANDSGELVLLDPGCVCGRQTAAVGWQVTQRAVRHDGRECKRTCVLMWAALSPCSSRLVNFCSLTKQRATGLSNVVTFAAP